MRTKKVSNIRVVQAEFVSGYTLRIHFDDGTVRDVDFTAPFSRLRGYYAQYREPEKFQDFRIENDTVAWGENWDVIYPVWNLYTNSFPV